MNQLPDRLHTVSSRGVFEGLLDHYRTIAPLRSKSLIISLFGDVVSPHGNEIWLGSVIRALLPFGINERLTRTAVFRLVREGWLVGHRSGRRSYYGFSDYGAHEYARAARRMYAAPGGHWSGSWQVIIQARAAAPGFPEEGLRRSLHWQGYRALMPGTWARPAPGGSDLRDTLAEFDALDRVVTFEARTDDIADLATVRGLVADAWRLGELADRYRQFIELFGGLAGNSGTRKHPPAPPESFLIRLLLIHAYRRILLNDTSLPEILLPPPWPGIEAQRLAASVYRSLAGPSASYICSALVCAQGNLPSAHPSFHDRFPDQHR